MNALREKALALDASDELASFRDQFYFPETHGHPVVYFTGNSLGLQPKSLKEAIKSELDDWARFGVEGHFEAKNPWYSFHELLMEPAAKLVGARAHEVVHMNSLTTNLHLLMVSFYRPKNGRYKILCEAKAFPSDQYALESQVKYHGYKPAEAIIEVDPRPGENIIREEDIEEKIRNHADEIALVMIGGVNYYTGQLFDMERIAKAGHAAGAIVGFDLAHAAGNVPMELHDWNVDFAAWCTYKYLNSGPGSVSGIFVHEKHGKNPDLPRFAGWWGHNKAERFQMKPGFDPIPGAEGWQLSNAPIFTMAPHLASLRIFAEAGMPRLRAKSLKLSAYLYDVLDAVKNTTGAELIVLTPKENDRKGCQLSLQIKGYGKEIFNHLMDSGVFVDWREPNVIRLAPVPLYNSFMDIWNFGKALEVGLRQNADHRSIETINE